MSCGPERPQSPRAVARAEQLRFYIAAHTYSDPGRWPSVALGERVLAVLGRPVLDGLEVPAEDALERLDHDAGLHRCPVSRRRLVDADGEGTEGDSRDRLLMALVHELVGDLFALGA